MAEKTIKLTKTQQELLDAINGGVTCYFMNHDFYYFRSDTMKRCTLAARKLRELGLVQVVRKNEYGGHVLKALGEGMMGHTKGPWEVDGNINGSAGVISEEGYWIVEPHWISTETGMANLHLIAAAPDLLEACKGMLEAFDYAGTRLVGKEWKAKEAIKAAITKATAQREGE